MLNVFVLIALKTTTVQWFNSWKGQKLFSPKHSDCLYSPPSLFHGHQGLFPREKQSGCKAHHTLHPEPRSLTHTAMLSLPPMPSTHGAEWTTGITVHFLKFNLVCVDTNSDVILFIQKRIMQQPHLNFAWLNDSWHFTSESRLIYDNQRGHMNGIYRVRYVLKNVHHIQYFANSNA
jgi:hypothetical protein